MQGSADGAWTGYVCPTCGGALRERQDGNGLLAYQFRIGHAFSAEQLWIEHCARRNRTLASAFRSLAENAALARALAEEARAIGKGTLAARLDEEAESEERYAGQVLEMLDGLPILDAAADSGG